MGDFQCDKSEDTMYAQPNNELLLSFGLVDHFSVTLTYKNAR